MGGTKETRNVAVDWHIAEHVLDARLPVHNHGHVIIYVPTLGGDVEAELSRRFHRPLTLLTLRLRILLHGNRTPGLQPLLGVFRDLIRGEPWIVASHPFASAERAGPND